MISLKAAASDDAIGEILVPDWVILDYLAPEIDALSARDNLKNAASVEALAAKLNLPPRMVGERLDRLWRGRSVLRLRARGGEVWMRKRGYQTWPSKLRSYRIEPPATRG